MARLRILSSQVAQFPTWWPPAAVAAAFEVVFDRPQVTLLPMPDWHWQAADFRRAMAVAEQATTPSAIYYRFDSWDDPSRAWRGDPAWAEDLHRYCQMATVVAGPQLPASGGPTHPLALPYPPLAPRRRRPPDLAASTLDVHFAGHWADPGWAAPPRDSRDPHHRGHLLAILGRAVPPDRLLARYDAYWNRSPGQQAALRRRSVAEMDRATIVLAPAGFGWLTFRHSDGWARGRVVLSEPMPHHTLVPEPERWDRGEIALIYDPREQDLVEVVTSALDDPERLERIARAGWEYGRRWTPPRVQAGLLAEALSEHL